jgi:carboxylesterase
MLRPPLDAVSGPLPFITKWGSDIADPLAQAQHLTYPQLPLAAVATLIDLLAQVRAGLSRITIPALIVYARHDHQVHPMNSMHIYSSIASRHKRLCVLHRGYHIVTVDYDKAQVFTLAADFIREHT